MARNKNLLPSFGLPYPLESQLGRRHVEDYLTKAAQILGEKYAKVMQFGTQEVAAQSEPLMELHSRIMAPAEETLNWAKGHLDVLRMLPGSFADATIAKAKDTLNKLTIGTPLGMTPYGEAYQGGAGPDSFYIWPGGSNGQNLKPLPGQQPGLIAPIGPRPILGQQPPGCQQPIIYLQCPACGVQQQCNWNLQILNQAIATAINQVMTRLSVSQWQQQSQIQRQQLIDNAVQQVIVNLPPQPEPQEQLGRDCGHALHVCLCGPVEDPRCLGSTVDNPLYLSLVVPDPKTCLQCPT